MSEALAARKIKNAMTLGQYPWMKGSSARTGVRQMRASVRMLGRVQRTRPPLAQRLEDNLAHRLQGVEHAVPADRHGLDVCRAPHPLVVDLVHQVLARVRRIGRDLLLRAVVDGLPWVQLGLVVAVSVEVRSVRSGAR